MNRTKTRSISSSGRWRLLLPAVLLAGACAGPPAATTTAVTVTPAATVPAKAPLPAAEAVLTAAVEAAGGAAAHDALTSYYTESHMEIASQGLFAETRLWWKTGKFFMEIDISGVGLTRVWCDGQTVTSEDPRNGRRTLEGREASQTRWAAGISLARDWKQFFTSATTLGRRDVDGKEVIDVELVGQDDAAVTLTFDATTHLLISQKFQQQSPMGAMPVEIAVVEYKPYAGLQHAARTEMRMSIFTAVTTLTKFDANVEIDDAKFVPADLPAVAAPAGTEVTGKPTPKTKAKSAG